STASAVCAVVLKIFTCSAAAGAAAAVVPAAPAISAVVLQIGTSLTAALFPFAVARASGAVVDIRSRDESRVLGPRPHGAGAEHETATHANGVLVLVREHPGALSEEIGGRLPLGADRFEVVIEEEHRHRVALEGADQELIVRRIVGEVHAGEDRGDARHLLE